MTGSLIDQWRTLPELKLPDGGEIEVVVLDTRVMVAPLAHLLAAGVVEYAALEDGAHGALATATIQRATGPHILRLPSGICEWAADCCSSIRRGASPFPARVRFRVSENGMEISFPDLAPRTRTPGHELIVYVDESGNTGDAAITGGLRGPQPSFALVGIGESDGAGTLNDILAELRRKHGIQALEIKGRAMDRRPEVIRDLVHRLSDQELPLFAEVMDKAFFVATNIVTYVLAGPWLPLTNEANRRIANVLADIVAEELGSRVVDAYCAFAIQRNDASLEAFRSTFHAEVGRARVRADEPLNRMMAEAAAMLDESIEARKHHSNTGYAPLLPPPDESQRGKLIAMLPHIPAFTHLYARINRFAPDNVTVRAIHDEQAHFGPLLMDYATTLQTNRHAQDLGALHPPGVANWSFAAGKCVLTFDDSKQSAGIQAADIIARLLTRRLNAVVDGSAATDSPVMQALWARQDPTRGLGINIVSTSRRFEAFWGDALSAGPFRAATKHDFVR